MSLYRIPSTMLPPAVTSKWNASIPCPRLSMSIVTRSDSTGRSRRVRRAIIGTSAVTSHRIARYSERSWISARQRVGNDTAAP